jgi:hypothetical protein
MSKGTNDINKHRIKAIETKYNGYRFRSRLEARWAVYFDALGLKWIYEPEGFDLGKSGYYLPDFWLPQVKMWAEVKSDKFTTDEMKKATALADITRHSVLQLVGIPDFKTYVAYDPFPLGSVAEIDRDIQCNCCGKANLIESRLQKCKECGASLDINSYFEDDYLISMYHDYPTSEHRFYANSGYGGEWYFGEDWPKDTVKDAIIAARSARFEHGENQ